MPKTDYTPFIIVAAALLVLAFVVLSSQPAPPPPPTCGGDWFCSIGQTIGGIFNYFGNVANIPFSIANASYQLTQNALLYGAVAITVLGGIYLWTKNK